MIANRLRAWIVKLAVCAWLLTLPAPVGTFASWSFVDSDGFSSDGTSSTTIAAPGVTVAVGDLIAVGIKWENTLGSITGVACSTDNLTEWSVGEVGNTLNTPNEPFHDIWYITAATVSGTNTIVCTATFNAGRPWRSIVVMVFRPSGGTPAIDGTWVHGIGQSSSASSGNITTTGVDGLAIASYATYGQVSSSMQINGTAAANTQIAGIVFPNASQMWNITYASGFTGAATATLDASNYWDVGLIAFKLGNGAASPKRLLLMGCCDAEGGP